MTVEDRLDDAVEERIREACPLRVDAHEKTAFCTCRAQRAAIIADREARPFRAEHRPQCAKHSCDLTSTIIDKWFCAVCEAALADRLAEALKGMEQAAKYWEPFLVISVLHGAEGEASDRKTNADRRVEARAALREHEERRR